MRFGCLPHAIASAAEELVEDIVLVGGQDESTDRQAHLARDMASEDVAEIARRNGEGDLLAIALRRCEVAFEIVDDLCRDASPVDRVHRPEPIARLECRIAGRSLDDVLT